MSTQTEPKLVTQIDFARAGQITPQMKEVAEREHRDPEYIRERVADGRIAIPANIVHIKKGMRAFGVGEGLSTKVNVNLRISGDKADAAEEWKKVKIAEDFGADAIMDLSNSGKTRQFRQQLIDETPLMVGTVPMYDAIGYMEKPLVKLTKDDLFEVVRAHAEDGVDFMTIHCGINKSVTKTFKETGRLMNIVSRGGSLLFGWMEVTGNENPFYEFYDELLEICHEYDVTISLGDSCRPGCLYDSNDATETAEMIELVQGGYGNIVCAQPFGCLPNHIVGKGMVNKIRALYPSANITPIDYDPSATRVNQENRIKLMLAVAKERLNAPAQAAPLTAEEIAGGAPRVETTV